MQYSLLFFAELQANDNAALIVGIVGGFCLLFIIVIAFILVARKRRLSPTGLIQISCSVLVINQYAFQDVFIFCIRN